MRGSKKAVIAGVVVAASAATATILKAQQRFGGGARPSALASAAGAPGNPSLAQRTARQLLKNGRDYLDTYGDHERALVFLREAQRRPAGLDDAEVKSLADALDRAEAARAEAPPVEVAEAPRQRRVIGSRRADVASLPRIDDPVRRVAAEAEILEPDEPPALVLPARPGEAPVDEPPLPVAADAPPVEPEPADSPAPAPAPEPIYLTGSGPQDAPADAPAPPVADGPAPAPELPSAPADLPSLPIPSADAPAPVDHEPVAEAPALAPAPHARPGSFDAPTSGPDGRAPSAPARGRADFGPDGGRPDSRPGPGGRAPGPGGRRASRLAVQLAAVVGGRVGGSSPAGRDAEPRVAPGRRGDRAEAGGGAEAQPPGPGSARWSHRRPPPEAPTTSARPAAWTCPGLPAPPRPGRSA